MKALTILLNGALFAFTAFVVATEGMPTHVAYIVFTLLMLIVPALNVLVLARPTVAPAGVAAGCNIALVGMICLAIANQYPHPAEPGLLEYEVLAFVTPILSAIVLLRGRTRSAAITL